MRSTRARLGALFATTALSVGVAAAPASAAPQGGPVVTGGLVNVTVVDAVDVNHNTVQLPISVAANVCGTTVQLLQADINQFGVAYCDADAGSQAQN